MTYCTSMKSMSSIYRLHEYTSITAKLMLIFDISVEAIVAINQKRVAEEGHKYDQLINSAIFAHSLPDTSLVPRPPSLYLPE